MIVNAYQIAKGFIRGNVEQVDQEWARAGLERLNDERTLAKEQGDILSKAEKYPNLARAFGTLARGHVRWDVSESYARELGCQWLKPEYMEGRLSKAKMSIIELDDAWEYWSDGIEVFIYCKRTDKIYSNDYITLHNIGEARGYVRDLRYKMEDLVWAFGEHLEIII